MDSGDSSVAEHPDTAEGLQEAMRVVLYNAFDSDPILFVIALVGMIVLVASILLRPGGTSARFTIDLFAYLATLASAIKAFTWVLMSMANQTATPPSGTDLLLLMGSFSAVILVTFQGLNASFFKDGGLSLVGKLVEDRPLPGWLEWLKRIPGVQGVKVNTGINPADPLLNPPPAPAPPPNPDDPEPI